MRAAVQLLAPTAATIADATLFTTSAVAPTIVDSIVVCNTTNGTITFSIAIGGTAATAANCIQNTVTVPANTTVIVSRFIVPATTAIHGLASSTGVTFSASGYVTGLAGS